MPKRPAIPEPVADVGSLQKTSQALREAVEILQGQRQPPRLAAVTWDDLVQLGLITPEQIPKVIGLRTTR